MIFLVSAWEPLLSLFPLSCSSWPPAPDWKGNQDIKKNRKIKKKLKKTKRKQRKN